KYKIVAQARSGVPHSSIGRAYLFILEARCTDLISADEHAQTSESPNMATATPPARRGPDAAEAARQVARAGRAAIRRQHPSSPRTRHGRSLPWCGELTFRAPARHRGPGP